MLQYPVYAALISTTYQLPPLQRVAVDSEIGKMVQNSQVIQRIEAQKLSFSNIDDPDVFNQRLLTEIQAKTAIEFEQHYYFSGQTTQELNELLQSIPPQTRVYITANRLLFNNPIHIPSHTQLLGNQTLITNADKQDNIFIAINQENFTINDFILENANIGLYIKNCQRFKLSQLRLENNQRGIVIQGQSQFGIIEHNRITGSHNSGLSLIGKVEKMLIQHNLISHGTDYFNWHAGLVLTDTPLMTQLHDEHKYNHLAVETAIHAANATIPGFNIIQHNEIQHNRASGIYMDGGVANVIQNNDLTSNDKEGLCLDGGSALNVVRFNQIANNGFRQRQTDEDLKRDFVLDFGKLADGSSVAKLPGISLDNAAYNLILSNSIQNNAGDGIKIVRSGFRNLFLFNSILSNNQGQNQRFHFFGILLGSAATDNPADHGLYDFLPSFENIIAGNTIYGQHFSGILLDKHSEFNDIYNNVIYKFHHASIESASQQFNSVVDNLYPDKNVQIAHYYKNWVWVGIILLFSMTMLILQIFILVKRR